MAAFRTTELAAALVDLIEGGSAALVAEILEPVPNFWDIVDYGDQAGEVRYSKMLGWLLDPQANHGLGPVFAQAFVDAAYGLDAAPTISPRARVHPREWRSIDILLVDYDESGTPVSTLVIENKTDTAEHPRARLGIGQTRWYNWVIRGDFVSIAAAIDEALLDDKHRRRLRRQLKKWQSATDDYRDVPDEGRHFVYLTPRPGEVAEDPEFRTLTYERLEALLTEAEELLSERAGGEAARDETTKIVRDFRRSIHRRFDVSLTGRMRALWEGSSTADPSSLAPEITGLAVEYGLVDAEHARSGDADYLALAVTPRDDAPSLLEEVNARLDRVPLAQVQLERLVDSLWAHRPRRTLNDTSKFYWGEDRRKKYSKIELLQMISLKFVEERGIQDLDEFQREFGAIVREVVDPSGPNPFVDAPILYDPDTSAFTPSAKARYKNREIAMRDRIGKVTFGAGNYRVRWELGCRSDHQAGIAAHLPVIRHFIAAGYPIVEAS